MATTEFSGPLVSGGAMTAIPAGAYGSAPVPDYNPDAGPSLFYQGSGVLDPRFVLLKGKLNGFAGVQPAFMRMSTLQSVDAVPAAYGTAKIAALQHATSGVAMSLAAANAAGITVAVPIVPLAGPNAGAVVNAPVVLDFGFAFGTTVAGSNIITVPDSTAFTLGMPLVIPFGAAIGAMLTYVIGQPSSTTITVSGNAPASGTLPIGTGNAWPGGVLGSVLPSAHLPYLAGGPGLFLDPGQALARGVSITASGGAGGNIVVSGWDVYWQPMTETIAVTGAATAYGKKAFKAIKSVTPAFTDAANNYSVGTSDTFGFAFRSGKWELTDVAWASASVVGIAGWTGTQPPAVGDVRGTFQASAIGGSAGYSATASNGAIVSRTMTGNRLVMLQMIGVSHMIGATPANPSGLFGATQT